MANNRLWLVHRPTGFTAHLGKRMAWGWYTSDISAQVDLDAFYARCTEALETGTEGSQDDFVLAIEDDQEGAPAATTAWHYVDGDPHRRLKLLGDTDANRTHHRR